MDSGIRTYREYEDSRIQNTGKLVGEVVIWGGGGGSKDKGNESISLELSWAWQPSDSSCPSGLNPL